MDTARLPIWPDGKRKQIYTCEGSAHLSLNHVAVMLYRLDLSSVPQRRWERIWVRTSNDLEVLECWVRSARFWHCMSGAGAVVRGSVAADSGTTYMTPALYDHTARKSRSRPYQEGRAGYHSPDRRAENLIIDKIIAHHERHNQI